MSSRQIIIGTRGSALALAQARDFAKRLEKGIPESSLVEKIIKTRGDARLDVSLASTGPLDKGLFTRELERALLDGEIDCAVHSLKDLPVEMPPGFVLGAILPRENPADVLVSKQGRELRRVATSSPRRARQLALEFPGVETCEIRGNVPTRLRKLHQEESLDGLVLALAGLKRLGFCNAQGEWVVDEFRDFELKLLDSMLPAPGQGAVAIQTRADDSELLELLQSIHCEETALCVTAERGLLLELGGGCHLALGARARIFQKKKTTLMELRAVYFPEEDCTSPWTGSVEGAPEHPHQLAAKLKNQWNKK